MSWSGFKKAVNRAGSNIILKTNKATTSVDVEFNTQESNFNKMDTYTRNLDAELSNFLSNFENLIEIMENMSKCLDSFYGDYSFDLKIDKNLVRLHDNHHQIEEQENENDYGTNEDGKVNNRDGISLSYLKIVNEIKMEVLPEILDPLNVTILEPINELKNYNEEINKLIKKRARKKIDYDLSNYKYVKLLNEYNTLMDSNRSSSHSNNSLNHGDQVSKLNEKLKKSKIEFEEIENIYTEINERLKNEIEQFINLRLSLIDPIFESYIKISLNFYNTILSKLESKNKFNIDGFSLQEHDESKIDDRLDEILLKMKSLDIKNL